jgi:hypothetical protein
MTRRRNEVKREKQALNPRYLLIAKDSFFCSTSIYQGEAAEERQNSMIQNLHN